MPVYQFTLLPLDKFFFGGEKHDADEKASYFTVSKPYPQQTTLLGLIRYYLLLKHDCLSPAKNGKQPRADCLIGKASFDCKVKQQSFGKIKSVSPLYLLFQDNPYVFAPLDVDYNVEMLHDNYILKKNNELYTDKKSSVYPKLTSIQTGELIDLIGGYKDKAMLFSSSQTGNEKRTDTENNNDAFYKQRSMKMKEGWCFAVDTEIDLELTDDDLVLPFGGEKSLFAVRMRKASPTSAIATLPQSYQRDLPALYCLSDCFADNSIFNFTCFAVNTTTSFRNLQSTTATNNYAAFGKNSLGLKRSDRFNLLERGSVLYFKDVGQRDKAVAMVTNGHYQSIGFNHFQLIN